MRMSDGTIESNYRWLILFVGTAGLVISNGLAIGGIPVFSRPIQNDLIAAGVISVDTAQSFIANASVITFLMSGVSSLAGAWLLRYVSIKILMLTGCLMLGSAFVIHSYADSIAAIYFSRFLIGTSLGFVGVTPSVVLVSGWFERRRGTALGILLTGTSIGGFLMPIVFAKMIELYQWRTAMLVVSGFIWFILMPVVVLFIREPAELANNDSAAIPDTGSTLEAVRFTGPTLPEALKTSKFWIFAAAAALIFYTIFVTTQQFILYLQSPKIGMSLAVASWLQSILFALSVTGKSAAGFLSDRFPAGRVTLWSTLLMFVSTLVLLLAGIPLLFLILYGLGYGATFVLLQRLVSEYFGRRDYARILGAITLIEILGGVVGGRVTGYLADLNGGDYTIAFYVLIVVTAAIVGCMFILDRKYTQSAY
jgi:MFS transporter, OFA family, oxalate/formate antiporter